MVYKSIRTAAPIGTGSPNLGAHSHAPEFIGLPKKIIEEFGLPPFNPPFVRVFNCKIILDRLFHL